MQIIADQNAKATQAATGPAEDAGPEDVLQRLLAQIDALPGTREEKDRKAFITEQLRTAGRAAIDLLKSR
ncbi:hypothetical protein [Nonomuraea aridisoli]|uniref:hypothetical protein n=1 Tax=Nonomuraea aridisoli TaxID=2070368 RepID=UPI0011B94ACB|nr:hypothetical protein [Nonomuraea aridisoli]